MGILLGLQREQSQTSTRRAPIPGQGTSHLLLVYKVQPWPCPPGLLPLLTSLPTLQPQSPSFDLFSSTPSPVLVFVHAAHLCLPRFSSSLAPPCASGFNYTVPFLAEKLSLAILATLPPVLVSLH